MLEEKRVDDPHLSEGVIGGHHHYHVLTALDNSSLSGFHLKAMLTSGMGFFTDAYDLFHHRCRTGNIDTYLEPQQV